MSVLTNNEFIFIIGSTRSGTTWLQSILADHPLIVSTVELTFFTAYIDPWIKAWELECEPIKTGKWVKGLPHLFNEEEFYSYLIKFLEMGYQKVKNKKPNATYILDKNPYNALYVDRIHQFLPNSRFIHIIRDGRDVVCSMRNVKKNVGFSTNNIKKGAEHWKKMVNSAIKASKFHDQYYEVRYEELLLDGYQILKRIFDFCGITITEKEIINLYDSHKFEIMKQNSLIPDPSIKIRVPGFYHKGKIGTWKEELSPQEQRIFYNIAGELLENLGYIESGLYYQFQRSYHKSLAFSSIKKRIKYLLWAILGEQFTQDMYKTIIKHF